MKLSQGRVLILDDEPEFGRSMAMMVEYLEMESQCVTNPDLFFGAVSQWKPTHIILDLIMPAMDGIIVLERLALGGCKARMAISSGLGDRDLKAAKSLATELGLDVTTVLPKPVRLSAMQEFLFQHPPSKQS